MLPPSRTFAAAALRCRGCKGCGLGIGLGRQSIATASASSRPPTAVLLMNMGGPRGLDDVHMFLHNLFTDCDIISLPFQSVSAPLLARSRVPRIKAQYAAIGGGSPILHWTSEQARKLSAELDRRCPETAPHKSYIAFRYVPPYTRDAVSMMLEDKVTRAVAFSQYMQYSCATSGSSLNELHRTLVRLDPARSISWSLVDRWPTHAGLVDAFASLINDELEAKYPAHRRDNVEIIFSAHSLPMSVVDRGDAYVGEVAATAHAVMRALELNYLARNPFRISWQSSVGPRRWMGPQTHHVLSQLAAKQTRDALVVPVSFTTDHIETLYELDKEYIEPLRAAGMLGLHRVRAFNDCDKFVSAMADTVRERLASSAGPWSHASNAFRTTCPSCTKPQCRAMRSYFMESKATEKRKPVEITL